MFVAATYPGTGHEQLTTIGRGRHTGRWITLDTATRHLHSFRAKLVYTQAVLRRYELIGHRPVSNEAEAVENAALLERIAAEQRASYHGGPHRSVPLPRVPRLRVSRCHGCLGAE